LARGFDLIQRSQNLSTKEWGQENGFFDSFVPILLSKKRRNPRLHRQEQKWTTMRQSQAWKKGLLQQMFV
jgi:hypothetical protein